MSDHYFYEDSEPRSSLILKNITVLGKRTSIRLEPEMWRELNQISDRVLSAQLMQRPIAAARFTPQRPLPHFARWSGSGAKVWISGTGERWRSRPEVYLRLLETKVSPARASSKTGRRQLTACSSGREQL